MGSARNLKRLLVAFTATAALLLVVSVSGAAPGTDASVIEFDQCANGGPPSTATDCPEKWINGILNANNSHYAEDEVTPQRVILELPNNSPTTGRTVEISYLTRKGGVHAYDSLATWNYTQTSADRCGANLSPVNCVPEPASTFPIPPDGTVVADNNGSGSATSAHQLGGQVFTMYGGTIDSVSAYSHDDASGSSDSYAHITLTYSVPSTAGGAKVMLLFGGHLAPSLGSRGWGVGVGSSSIEGGPYHIRITAADGASVGNRDNQIMSGAILAPANILIRKVAVGGDATFNYSTTGGPPLSGFSITTSGGTGSQSYTNVSAGSYTVTESTPLPDGWDFTSLVCQDEDNGTSINGMTANIDLDSGETVICTYTNTKRGRIIVKKETNPDADPQSFAFTASYDTDGFSLSDGQQNDSGLLVPGNYSVAETVPAGWDMTSSCDDGSNPSSIGLGAGETVTCTFVNSRRGRIIVEKQTIPNGDSATFGFSGEITATLGDGQSASKDVSMGTYTVSEAVPEGWALTSIVCDDGNSSGSGSTATFNVEAGETVKCVFTNTKAGQIIVQKQTDPDGSPQSFAFTASYDADGFSLTDGQSNNSGSLAPGNYSVSETVPAGWDLTSAVCSDQSDPDEIHLAAGETVTCVFNNRLKRASIIVEKQTNPNGATQLFTFTASYDADGFSLSDGQQNNSGPLLPGTYSVSETVPAGWELDSVVCSDQSDADEIDLDPGETVTCVFTNEKDAKIIVEKQTIPNGDPQSFAFTASYDDNGFSLKDGESNNSGDLDPGTYSVSETVPEGWNLTSAICSDQSDPDEIGLSAGETVTCVFTNTKRGRIVVEKQTDPNGDPQLFSFTASYDADGFSLSDGQQNDSGSLAPGTYSVDEVVPAGWDLTSEVCSDQSDPDEIDLDAGETVTCVFTNTKRGQIIVEKQTDPDGHQQAFEFEASYDADGFSLSDGQQNNSGNLEPGTYEVDEVVPDGWDLTSAVCDDRSDPGEIHLAAGETVTCVFSNRLRRGQIIVQKQTDPNGDPQLFSFTASYDADGFSLSDGQSNNSGALLPGTYSVSETVPAGWDLASKTCDDGSAPEAIDLDAGETVTCVFNNEKDAFIIVEKQTNPDGDPQSFSFTASYDNDGFSLTDGQSNNSGDLSPGEYSVSENVPAGWDLESAVCSDQSDPEEIDLAAGETVTCVFTNEKDAVIIVQKQTDPDGHTQSFDFDASYDDDGFSLTDGQSNNSGDLDPGTYSVSENVPDGWDLVSAVCSDDSPKNAIVLSAGETVTCVFTNKLRRGQIIVEKQTDPNGDPQLFSFTASYDADGFSLSDGQSNNSGDLLPGEYSVSENVPAGWDLESAVCSDESDPEEIDLDPGETVTCVFTNQKDAVIIVEKQTNPNGDPQVFDFDASYDEGGFSLSDGESNDSGELDPGTYSVSENVPDGWDLTSAVCSDESDPEAIALAAGETVTCVFTNTKLGSIIVEKQTSPNGIAGSFSFSGDAAGSISDNGQIVVSNLLPGTYSSTEAAADGFALTSISCDDANSTGSLATRAATFRLEAGETVKCVFTNAKLATGLGSIEVSKSADPTSVQEPGGLVTFSVTVRNTSPDVDLTVTNVVDNVFGDLDDDGGSGCFDVPINLAPGQSVNCTFQKQITGSAGSSHVNTVTASGRDEFGNSLSDSDDARVDITPRLIDLVIVKEASSPTPLNGIVNYRMTVTNKGPDTATNVQLADPAPAGITYLSANPSQGTCSVTAALITCSLGTIAPGQTVTIAVTARATQVGTHTNTATVTGSGGRETNPADNVDSAVTVVPAPIKPPKAKPKPKPEPEVCLTLVVSPKMITADGKPEKVTVRTLKGKKRVKGVKVLVSGSGVRKSARSNGNGVAVLRINPRKAGLITITALETGDQQVCGAKRIGVVGVFLPPLTG